MDGALVDFSGERLVRMAPEWAIPLEPADRDYLAATFTVLRETFPGQVPATPPLGALPARALMRLLIDLRRLRPADPSPEQRSALGTLASAISLFHNACAFAVARDKARLSSPRDDPGQ